jgi:myo-inositol-1(or 4)-monophosphatase
MERQFHHHVLWNINSSLSLPISTLEQWGIYFMTDESTRLLDAMIAAAKEAGAGLAEDHARANTLDIRRKSGADFYSEADLRAESTIRRVLGFAAPTFGFLGEEGGHVAGEDPDATWIVDPLDGTTNFLRGTALFAVNIALEQHGEIVAAVTYVPMMNELFHAQKNHGAFLNGTRIHVSKSQGIDDAVLAVGIPFGGKPRQEYFLREMRRLMPQVAGIRRLGAGAIDSAWVAAGRFDAYWEQSVAPWDMAAGALLISEAGGVVSDTAGRPLDIRGGTFLGCTPAIHETLLEALAPECA